MIAPGRGAPPRPIVVPARYFPVAFSLLCALALGGALIVSTRSHFHQLVQTHCTPPLDPVREMSFRNWLFDTEYWPSISAVIGDNMPERAIWRVALALATAPFIVTYVQLVRFYSRLEGGASGAAHSDKNHDDAAGTSQRGPGFTLVTFISICAALRIPSAFGYSYIASFEHLFYHEASFVMYMLFGAAIQIATVVLAKRHMHSIPRDRGFLSYRLKLLFLIGQSICVCAVVRFFGIDHSVHCTPGAYSWSNMFEWCFAFFNLAFDATAYFELADMSIVIGADSSSASSSDAFAGADVLSFRSSPGNEVFMWLFDVSFGYLLVSSWNQLMQQVYFIPMVAMRFTPEALLAMFPPVATLILTRVVPSFRRVLEGDASLHLIVHAQKVMLGLTAFAILSFFHIDFLVSPERKIIMASLGPVVLLPMYRIRSMLVSAKAAAVCARQGADSREATDVFTMSVASEQRRLVYAIPFGFAFAMAVRIAGVSQDPFFVEPLFNLLAAISMGAFIVAGPLRSLLFESRLLNEKTTGPELGASTGTPVAPTWAGGVLFGATMGLSLTVISAPGTMLRYVALDPIKDWWAPAAVIVAVLVGTAHAASFLAGAKEAGKNPRGVLSLLTIVGVLVLYYGTTQSNRMFQADAKVLEKWVMEDYSGSPLFAFVCGGLVLAFSLGVWWPQVCAWTFGFAPEVVAVDTAVFAVARGPGAQHGGVTATQADFASYALQAGILLGGMYCVCFPFVPGGDLLRDRLNVVLIGAVLALVGAAALCATHASAQPGTARRIDLSPRPSLHAGTSPSRVKPASIAIAIAALTVLFTIARVLSFSEAPLPIRKLENGEPEATLRTGIWTVHFGHDNYGVDSMARLTKMVKDAEVNVIGLLESDQMRMINGNRDLIEYMAYHLGFPHSDFGPTTLDSTFGCAMISRWPIKKTHRIVLPSPMGELSCLIHAWVQVLPEPAPPVHIYVGHWGNTQHVQDVVLQSDTLGQLTSKYPGPSVFVGYLVTKAGYKNYYRMVQSDGPEEDELLRRSAPEGSVEDTDGITDWKPEQDGHPLPKIPIVKKTTGLLRDVARDMTRGVNPFYNGRVNKQEHAAARDDLNTPLPPSLYWEVHALPEPLPHAFLVWDGKNISDELRGKFAASQRLDKIRDEFAKRSTTVAASGEASKPFEEPKAARSLAKLQRAAEYKARKMVQTLKDGDEVHKKAPSELRKAVQFLDEHTEVNGRNSTAMVYYYPNTGRVSMRHPRYEYEDRYCQYVLYRSMPLLDWYRVLDIDELSDTELQVATFRLSPSTVDFDSFQ